MRETQYKFAQRLEIAVFHRAHAVIAVQVADGKGIEIVLDGANLVVLKADVLHSVGRTVGFVDVCFQIPVSSPRRPSFESNCRGYRCC